MLKSCFLLLFNCLLNILNSMSIGVFCFLVPTTNLSLKLSCRGIIMHKF